MALISVDTLYTTYDTYTSADALDYAQSPSTYVEKGTDSATYFTKVKSITVADSFGYARNIYTSARLSAPLTAGVTTTAAISLVSGDNFPSSGYALIMAEVVYYASTTEDATPTTTSLDTLTRAESYTVDVTHGAAQSVFPLVAGSVVSIDHNPELNVFNINTIATITSSQYADIVEVNMYTIPESLVAMVKYAA